MSSLAVSGPAQLVAALPYLLGFEPTNSVVGVFMRDSRIVLTVRISACDDVAQGLQRGADVSAAEQVAIVIVDAEVADLVPERVVPEGVVVTDIISVRAGTWRSLLCTDSRCCPPQGNDISQEVRDQVAAAFVADGVVPLADRAAMTAMFIHTPDEGFADVVELAADDAVVVLGLDAGPASLRRWREDTADDLGATLEICPDDVYAQARCVVGLQDIRVRDVVLHRLSQSPDLRVVAEWLRGVAITSPSPYAAAIYTVCAAAYWQGGDGAKACEALEQALLLDPDYSLAMLLHRAIQAGMPPATWRQALQDTSEEECFTGAA